MIHRLRKVTLAALVACAAAPAAHAVGLGPLSEEGVTRTDRKGFYLTVINPYDRVERFRLYGAGWDSEVREPNVAIPVSEITVAPKGQRRILVVATNLAAGEEHKFRVCAEQVPPNQELVIHARVCSKLSARRIG